MQVLADPLALLKRRLQVALPLAQRLFQTFAACDIGRRAEHHRGSALLVENRPLHSLDPVTVPSRIRDHFFRDKDVLKGIHHLQILLAKERDLFLVRIEVDVGFADQLVHRRPVRISKYFVDQGKSAIMILGEDEIGIDVEYLPEKGVGFPQLFFRQLALGDVFDDGDQMMIDAPWKGHARGIDRHPDRLSVLPNVPLFQSIAGYLATSRLGGQGPVMRKIVRMGKERIGLPKNFVLLVADQFAEHSIDLQIPSLFVQHRHSQRRFLD